MEKKQLQQSNALAYRSTAYIRNVFMTVSCENEPNWNLSKGVTSSGTNFSKYFQFLNCLSGWGWGGGALVSWFAFMAANHFYPSLILPDKAGNTKGEVSLYH